MNNNNNNWNPELLLLDTLSELLDTICTLHENKASKKDIDKVIKEARKFITGEVN